MRSFDVFISYKHSDSNGSLTPEVGMADELYGVLTSRGIKTFYSKAMITTLGEAKYKEVIDKALDDAVVMVAVASSVENITSNWVQYEWEGFHQDILSGRKENCQLISFLDGIATKDLPRSLRHQQAFFKGESASEDIANFIEGCLKGCPDDGGGVGLSAIEVIPAMKMADHNVLIDDVVDLMAKADERRFPGKKNKRFRRGGETWGELIGSSDALCSVMVGDRGEVLGSLLMVGLSDDWENLLCERILSGNDIDGEEIAALHEKGSHVAYLMGFHVRPSVESSDAYDLLGNELFRLVKVLARDDESYISKIYCQLQPEEIPRFTSMGFYSLECPNEGLFVLDLSSEATLSSIDAELAEIYGSARNGQIIEKESDDFKREAQESYNSLWNQIERLFHSNTNFRRLEKYFIEGEGVPSNSRQHKQALAVAEWLRDILQYSAALLPYIPEERRKAHHDYEQRVMSSDIVKESMGQYAFTTERKESAPRYDVSSGASIRSIMTFARIWLDIDKLFMSSQLMDYKPYFYERSNELPPEEDLELCEGLALRILSGMIVSEDQLRHIPEAFEESYIEYKETICESAIVQDVIEKYPFIEQELWGYSDTVV